MTPLVHQLNAAAGAWTGLMLAILWQSSVLAVVIALAAVAARRSSPAVRYWLWQILAIKLLIMPFWTVGVPWPEWFGQPPPPEVTQIAPADDDLSSGAAPPVTRTLPASGSLAEDSARAASTEPHWLARITWQAWLLVGWAAVVLLQAARVAVQRRRLSRLLSAARPADAPLAARVARVADELKLKRAPAVLVSDAAGSPFVCGLWTAALVLPGALPGTLDETQFRHVLFHELAHMKRRDLLWGWIPEIARIVYFFHPVAHWMTWRLRLERELACDQIAMTHTGRDARAYADTLVQVVSQQSEPAALRAAAGAAGIGGGSSIEPQTAPTHSEAAL